jgi:uncharacterized protein YndB with AHSA1/START domain
VTQQKSLKRRVRARMAKTGERYTAARHQLLARQADPAVDVPAEAPPTSPQPEMSEPVPASQEFRGLRSASDEAITRRTGAAWNHWLRLLEEWGAADRPHAEIARWLNEVHGVDGWWAQELTVRYEMTTGRRQPGQRPDGFSITASKTVAVPVERLYDAFVDPDVRAAWLPEASMRLRTATPHRTARFDWADGDERIAMNFASKGEGRSNAALEHSRIPDAEAAETMKAFWRDRMKDLQRYLER